MRYFNKLERASNGIKLTVDSNIVIPPTLQGVVGKMKIYIDEAHSIAQRYRKEVVFSYLGVEARVSGKGPAQFALTRWIFDMQRRAVQKRVTSLPRFLIDPKWFEWVYTFHDRDSVLTIVKASEIATMINYFCYKEQRDLEMILSRYWELVTFGVDAITLNDIMIILSDCWKEEAYGYRVRAWHKRVREPLYQKFSLIVDAKNNVSKSSA